MVRSCAVAICVALVTTISKSASAQAVALVESARVQGGFVTERRPAPIARLDNWYIGALPSITLLSVTPRTELSLGYGFSGALHSTYPNQTGHTLSLNGRFQLTLRTTMFLQATAARTTLTNRLLSQPVGAAPTLFSTGSSTDVVTASVGQGLGYEVSRNVRAEQHLGVTLFTTLAPSPPLDSFATTVGGSIERVWEHDAVGPEATIGYSIVRAAPPFANQDFIIGNAGPHWRHDWSRTISTLFAAGAAGLVSPNGSAESILAPFARGSLLYAVEVGTGFSVNASTNVTPNPLTGQILRAHQGHITAFAPLSNAAQIYGAATVGYLRGALVGRGNANDQEFNSFNADIEVAWRPTDIFELFARYSFLGQIVEDAPARGALPTFLRDSFTVGFGLSSPPPNFSGRRRTRGLQGQGEGGVFPERVDRADAPPREQEQREQREQQEREQERRPANAPDPARRPNQPPEVVPGNRWIYETPARPPEDLDRQRPPRR